ncbi:unnamed protein product [Vicia faba]|uniref:BRCA2 OB1 domain-containing protein n=1 Tax=Vicia faba TaxID=3906 RepID=A0AAV1A0J9_VICFA|nr:unnamed protein product [Vicia faba]
MYNLGVAHGDMLKFDMAIVFYELAFHYNPHYAEACNNLGVIYKDRDNLDKASKMDAATSMIEKAIITNLTYAEAYNNLGVLYKDAGDIALANNAYEQRLKIDPNSRNAGQNRLLAMNYIDERNDDKLFEAHRDWGRRFIRLYQPFTSWNNSKDPEGFKKHYATLQVELTDEWYPINAILDVPLSKQLAAGRLFSVLKASLLSDSSYKVNFSQLAIIFIIVIISALLLSPTHATPKPKKSEDSDEGIKTKHTRLRRTIIVLLHIWISEALPTCLQ